MTRTQGGKEIKTSGRKKGALGRFNQTLDSWERLRYGRFGEKGKEGEKKGV